MGRVGDCIECWGGLCIVPRVDGCIDGGEDGFSVCEAWRSRVITPPSLDSHIDADLNPVLDPALDTDLDTDLDSGPDSGLDSHLDSISYPTFSTPAQCMDWPVAAAKAAAASVVERRARSVSAHGLTSLERSPGVLESSLNVSR